MAAWSWRSWDSTVPCFPWKREADHEEEVDQWFCISSDFPMIYRRKDNWIVSIGCKSSNWRCPVVLVGVFSASWKMLLWIF